MKCCPILQKYRSVYGIGASLVHSHIPTVCTLFVQNVIILKTGTEVQFFKDNITYYHIFGALSPPPGAAPLFSESTDRSDAGKTGGSDHMKEDLTGNRVDFLPHRKPGGHEPEKKRHGMWSHGGVSQSGRRKFSLRPLSRTPCDTHTHTLLERLCLAAGSDPWCHTSSIRWMFTLSCDHWNWKTRMNTSWLKEWMQYGRVWLCVIARWECVSVCVCYLRSGERGVVCDRVGLDQ